MADRDAAELGRRVAEVFQEVGLGAHFPAAASAELALPGADEKFSETRVRSTQPDVRRNTVR